MFPQSSRFLGIDPFIIVPDGSGTKADERNRTADPFITSEVLYQLSYVGPGPWGRGCQE